MDERPSLDIGHLSAEEIETIRSVLERDGILQREVDAKRQRVQQELHKMRKMSAMHGSQPSASNACARCHEPLGMLIGRGEVCPECKELVCPHCKKTGDLIPALLGWVCTYCLLQRQGKFQSGDWFYGGSAAAAKQDQPSDALRKIVVEAKGNVSPKPKAAAARKSSSEKARTLDSHARGPASGAALHDPGKRKSVDSLGRGAKPGRKKKRSIDSLSAEGQSRDTAEEKPGRKRKGNSAAGDPSTAAATGGGVLAAAAAAVVEASARSPPSSQRTAANNIRGTKMMAMAEQEDESEASPTSSSHPEKSPVSTTQSTSPKLTHLTKNRSHGNNRKPPTMEFRRGRHVESSHSEESSPESTAAVVAKTVATEVETVATGADLADEKAMENNEAEAGMTMHTTSSVVGTAMRVTSSDAPDKLAQHTEAAAEELTTGAADPDPGIADEGRDPEHSDSDESYLTESSYHEQDARMLPTPVRALDSATAPSPPADAEAEEALQDSAETTPTPRAQDRAPDVQTAVGSKQLSEGTDEPRSANVDNADPSPAGGEPPKSDEEEEGEPRLRVRSEASGGGSFHGLQRRSNVKRDRRSGHGERLHSNASGRSDRVQYDANEAVSRGSSVPASGNPMDIEATLMAAVGQLQQVGEADGDIAPTASSPVLSERERARHAALERVRQKRAMSAHDDASSSQQPATASTATDESAVDVRADSISTTTAATTAATTVPVGIAAASSESAEQPLSSREQARRKAVAKLHMRRSQQAAATADRTSTFTDRSRNTPGEAEADDETAKQRISRRKSTVVPRFLSGSMEHDPEFDDDEFHGSDSDEEDSFPSPRKVSVKRATPVKRSNASKIRSFRKSDVPDQDPISRRHQSELFAKAPVPGLQHPHAGDEGSSEDEESMNVDDYFSAGTAPANMSSSRPSDLPGNSSEPQDEVGDEKDSWVHSIDARDNQLCIGGDLQFELCYKKGALHVRLDGCTHLSRTKEFSSIHAKLYLLPDLGKQGKRVTAQQTFSTGPIFNQDFSFKVGKDELHYRTLSMSLWLRQSSASSHNLFYGAVNLDCRRLALDFSWSQHSEPLRDEPPISGLAAAGSHRCSGSLSLAVRCGNTRDGWCQVDVRVQQGSGISATDPDDLADPFVRGLLLPGVKSSQTTAVCKRTLQPVWDETLRFAEVRLAELPWWALELSVWDHDAVNGNDFLGAVRLGFSSASTLDADAAHDAAWRDMSADEEAMWREMLSRPGEWIDAELALRDISPHH